MDLCRPSTYSDPKANAQGQGGVGRMDSEQFDRREAWVPEPRPQWLADFNALGTLVDMKGIVPLDEDTLLGTAARNTGLSDFGDDSWRPHFRMLLKLIEEEATLN